MASTFLSSRSPYPVFINYFPGNMSYALAIKIFHTLTKAHKGLRVFLNNVAPELGDSVATETEDAILRAKLHIAIFTPSYAQSPCCLEELVLMLRSRTKIIPVFYDVEPFHLRWVDQGKGVYVDAFSGHEKQKRYKPQRLQAWKTALYYASLFYGYELKNTENEGMLLKSIVNHTLTVQLGSIQFNSMASISSSSTASSKAYSIGKVPPLASSSSSMSYDVFTNHRRVIDVHHTLPADIYHKLDSNGLRTFLNQVMEPGLSIPRKIEMAMLRTKLHIAIFSPDNALSPWCLDELSFMVKAGTPIIPIFYDVKPSTKAYNMGKAFDGVLRISSLSVQLSSTQFNSMAPICSSSTTSSEAYNIGNALDGVLPQPPLVLSSSSMSYDVLINHRGIDAKHSLAADIYHKLDSNGLRTFLDQEVLEPGSSIPMEIEEAMLSAKLHIAIISPSYAQSPWCLQELSFMCFMLKTGTTILPVFYDVEPSDIQCIGQDKGIYREDFRRYEEKGRYAPEKLREWKTALCIVSSFPGYKLKNNEENDRLLKSILNCALQITEKCR